MSKRKLELPITEYNTITWKRQNMAAIILRDIVEEAVNNEGATFSNEDDVADYLRTISSRSSTNSNRMQSLLKTLDLVPGERTDHVRNFIRFSTDEKGQRNIQIRTINNF